MYKTGHITVQFPPSFKSTPMTEAWSWQQRPVNLTCLAESIPNATIIWKFRETEIRGNNAFVELLQPGPYSILRVINVLQLENRQLKFNFRYGLWI